MKVNESIFRDILRLLVWYPLRWLIRILPVRLGIALLSLMGDFHFTFAKKKKRVLSDNLLHINPQAISQDTIIKEYFRNHYIDHLLIFNFSKFVYKEVKRFLEIKGLEYLDESLKKGKGVIAIKSIEQAQFDAWIHIYQEC